MRRTGADSLEDLTSELENFEKNKNEHMFPELTHSATLFANILAFLNVFLSPFSQAALVSPRSNARCVTVS